MVFEIPPAHHEHSVPYLADRLYPNQQHENAVRCPIKIWEVIRNEMPTLTHILTLEGNLLSLWDTVNVIRDSESLGCLTDICLALQFAMNA